MGEESIKDCALAINGTTSDAMGRWVTIADKLKTILPAWGDRELPTSFTLAQQRDGPPPLRLIGFGGDRGGLLIVYIFGSR